MRSRVRIRAFAKINLTLRILGTRPDGYHELRTTFQSLALHDTLTFSMTRGPFEIICDEPRCPTGRTNLVCQAAARVWRAARRTGAPRGVRVRIDKRIPLAAGLGGGSADAAAALRAFAALWRVRPDEDQMHAMAADLGADVPFFLHGGTALGVDRGDVLYPLDDVPNAWVVLALPAFGVSTKDAYAWFDAKAHATPKGSRHNEKSTLHLPASDLGNDLQAPAVVRHPEIGRLIRALERAGAAYAAMSGSGSAVFGLFDARRTAFDAADALVGQTQHVIVTRTISGGEYERLTRPTLARK